MPDGAGRRGIVARQEAGGIEHVPYLLPSWRRRYVAIGLFRGAGVRAYRNITRLVRFRRDDLSFHGPVAVHEADRPKLSRLRFFVHVASRSGWATQCQPRAAAADAEQQDPSDS